MLKPAILQPPRPTKMQGLRIGHSRRRVRAVRHPRGSRAPTPLYQKYMTSRPTSVRCPAQVAPSRCSICRSSKRSPQSKRMPLLPPLLIPKQMRPMLQNNAGTRVDAVSLCNELALPLPSLLHPSLITFYRIAPSFLFFIYSPSPRAHQSGDTKVAELLFFVSFCYDVNDFAHTLFHPSI